MQTYQEDWIVLALMMVLSLAAWFMALYAITHPRKKDDTPRDQSGFPLGGGE